MHPGCEGVPGRTLCPPTIRKRSPRPVTAPLSHPCLAPALPLPGLLTEIINSRLFTTVRDTLGLTYDVSFELSLFDRLPSGARQHSSGQTWCQPRGSVGARWC